MSGLGKDVFTVGQIATILGVCPATVIAHIDSGKIRAYALPGSGRRRVTAEDLFNYLQFHRRPLLDFVTQNITHQQAANGGLEP